MPANNVPRSSHLQGGRGAGGNKCRSNLDVPAVRWAPDRGRGKWVSGARRLARTTVPIPNENGRMECLVPFLVL